MTEEGTKKKIIEAAALRYDPDKDNAPRVVAAGKGVAAANIIKTAREHNIPLYTDAVLTHALSKLLLGSEIPVELYEVVAKILVYISRIDTKYGESVAQK